ncbi:peptidase associated/transthyretin-like domain-containing protein [Arcticibacter eurypsychrophilus]|uniref:carboxypeptidase-like regulatory domain-containing protein n=1 Tax=Arcticibacter eurypsychrophilus TaxID=1434752 RepID=UPI00084D7C72|nr:carboxypeptidase-like regulatory domain-containing protein [Arcticibacter eurypsychrophilus]
MKIIFTAVIILFITGYTKAQEKPLVQFSGIIYNIDSNVVVPYVTVTNRSKQNKTVSANFQGYFSFVANEGDTIVFSSVGYRREALVIPPDREDKSYTVIVKMKPEVVNLPMVTVLPWASVDEFTKEFMSLKFADDDLEIAKKNVTRSSLLAMAKNLPRDGQEMRGVNFQNNHIALTNKAMNMRMANPLLNPFAWGSFIQQIINGDKGKGNN